MFMCLSVNKIKKWQQNVYELIQAKRIASLGNNKYKNNNSKWQVTLRNNTLKQKRNCFGINATQQKTTLYLYKIDGNV